MVNFYIKRYPFESGFQSNKWRAILSFLTQVMSVLLKCVWLAEGNSTCRVGNLDMLRCSRVEPEFLFWEEDCWICRVEHLNMSRFPTRHVKLPSASQTHFSKTGITWARKLKIVRRLLRWNPDSKGYLLI